MTHLHHTDAVEGQVVSDGVGPAVVRPEGSQAGGAEEWDEGPGQAVEGPGGRGRWVGGPGWPPTGGLERWEGKAWAKPGVAGGGGGQEEEERCRQHSGSQHIGIKCLQTE